MEPLNYLRTCQELVMGGGVGGGGGCAGVRFTGPEPVTVPADTESFPGAIADNDVMFKKWCLGQGRPPRGPRSRGALRRARGALGS